MTGNKFKFINITSYAPEQFNVLDEDNKLIAYVRTRWGKTTVYPYENNDINWDKELFNINYDEEFLGAIPDNMKNDIFESISKKLHNYLNDTK